MDVTSSTRSPVRTTYLQRPKRKPTSSEQIDAKSDTSSDSPSQRDATTPSMKPLSHQSKVNKPRSTSSLKSISTKQLSRRIDHRDVPGPTPKQIRRGSEDGSEKGAANKSSNLSKRSNRMRASSVSISSLNQVKAAASSRSVRGAAKPKSEATSVSHSVGEEDNDDESIADSIADSVASAPEGGRIHRGVKDRKEYYKNQSDCHIFGPYRAVCSRCKQVVTLNRSERFAVGPWERHRVKCDQQLASDSPMPPNVEELVNAPYDEVFAEQPVRRNAAQRRVLLLEDKHAETVEEKRVKCAECKLWVPLTGGSYALAKWRQHRTKCAPDARDNHLLSIGNNLAIPRMKGIGSSGQDHDAGAWEDHKAQCSSQAQTGTPSGVNSVPFPPKSSAKPISTASTEVTVVATTETTSNDAELTPQSTKRTHNDNDNDVRDERPHNRPRTETYEPPIIEAPSVMGWFMLPFKSFARGFRESLKAESS